MTIVEWMTERYNLTYRLGNWAAHGVLPALEGTTAEAANWRPCHGQHTIAEIVAHVACHTELAAKRLRGDPWEYRPEDEWQAGPPTEEGWEQVRARLEAAHIDLAAVIADVDAGQLLEPLYGSWIVARGSPQSW